MRCSELQPVSSDLIKTGPEPEGQFSVSESPIFNSTMTKLEAIAIIAVR